MKRTLPLLFLSTALFQGLCLAGESRVTVQNPAAQTTLRVNSSGGNFQIRGGATDGLIVVHSSEDAQAPKEREDGLRVLGDTEAGFNLKTEGNLVTLIHNKEAWNQNASFSITVPSNTSVELNATWKGTVAIEDVQGDLSIKVMNGTVDLKGIEGAANVELMNGKIEADCTRLSADKPISMSCLNGSILLRVPEEAGATVRFRTHKGSILTDFPEERLKTQTDNSYNASWQDIAGKQVVIATTIIKELGKEIGEHARSVSEEIHTTVEEIRKDLEKQKKAKKSSEQAATEAGTPTPPIPPKPVSIPAFSGGKVVSGSLNEGGANIELTVMNGGITFRKRPVQN